MKRSVSVFTAAVAALLLAGSSARAADIPWQFNWTPSGGPDLTTHAGDPSGTLRLASSGGANSYLQVTNEPIGKAVGNAAGTSDLTMTGLKVFSDAPPVTLGSPNLDASNPVNFSLRLTDKASGAFHDFLFTIKFGGYFNSGAAKVTATVMGPSSYTDQAIGGNFYTVDQLVYLKPGPPDSTNPAGISVTVSVRPVDIQKAPEPSTMVLSCVGLSFLGLAGWRKRRQAALQLA